MSDRSSAPVLAGGCLCGAVRFASTGAPTLVSYCHCRMCQKSTGGPFSVMANFGVDELRWTGKERAFRRSSPFAVRGFCADCGSPLSFQYDDSDHVSVPVGVLDSPQTVRPTAHGGIESKLPWAAIGEDLPQERCDDDPDYRSLVERTGWKPPF